MAQGVRRGWRYRRSLSVTVAVGVVVALSACSSVAPADPTPTPVETGSASASPTPTVMVVAGGERPPAIVDDCAELISVEEMSAALDTQVLSVDTLVPDEATVNAGAVRCGWSLGSGDPSAQGLFWVMPRAGMDEGEFAPYRAMAGASCDNGGCSSTVVGENTLVTVSLRSGTDSVDTGSVAARTAEAISRETGDDPVEWVRDRTPWVVPVDCDAVGDALAQAIGRDVDVWSSSGDGTLSPWLAAADRASRLTACEVHATSGDSETINILVTAGMAWSLQPDEQGGYSPAVPDLVPFELSSAGVAAYTDADRRVLYFSDSANRVRVSYFAQGDSVSFDSELNVFSPELVSDVVAGIFDGKFAA